MQRKEGRKGRTDRDEDGEECNLGLKLPSREQERAAISEGSDPPRFHPYFRRTILFIPLSRSPDRPLEITREIFGIEWRTIKRLHLNNLRPMLGSIRLGPS